MDRKLTVSLWIVQGVLAALFLMAGVMKFVTPADTLAKQTHMSATFLRFIGAFEVLGALGLILPGIAKVRPELTPLAAAGLVIIMIGATVVTFMQGGGATAAFPAVIGVLCAAVVYGRGRKRAAPTAS